MKAVYEDFSTEKEARRLQRKEDAELCRAAGCICRKFRSRAVYDTADPLYGYGDEDGGPRILIHDPRCPEALADQIEARGKEKG